MKFFIIILVIVFSNYFTTAYCGCNVNPFIHDANNLLNDVEFIPILESVKSDFALDTINGNVQKRVREMRKKLESYGDLISNLKDEEIYLLERIDSKLQQKFGPRELKNKRADVILALKKGPC